jgi:hypothetical protein
MRINKIVTSVLAVSVLSVLTFVLTRPPVYHVGDTIRVTSHTIMQGSTLAIRNHRAVVVGVSEDLFCRIGTIEGTYEYNNYHETNLHTGYLISFNHTDVEFDEPTFTLVKHK